MPETPRPVPAGTWRAYITLLLAVVGAFALLNIAAIRWRAAEDRASSKRFQSLSSGDAHARQALLGEVVREMRLPLGGDPRANAQKAIAAWRQALPAPAAYRRTGIARIYFLGEAGPADLLRIDSPRATKGLSPAQVAKLRSEAAMWRDVFGGDLTRREAERYAARVRKLNLGPLRLVAAGIVYRQATMRDEAQAAFRQARDSASYSVALAGGLLVLLVLGGLVGGGLLIYFLSKHGPLLDSRPRPAIQPTVLIISFLAYFVAQVLLSTVASVVMALGGFDDAVGVGAVAGLVVNILVPIAAAALGLAALQWLTAHTREDPSEIGLKRVSAWQSIKWGVGGYCASLPVLLVSTIISYIAVRIVIKGFEPTEHPIVPFAAGGGWAFIVAFVLAAVIAPIVEEIVFRGMLYGAFRGTMGVWPAAALSAAVFSIVHPTLPAGFLPIMGLGVVLALLREKTGSLIPAMLCHALNNAVLLLFVKLAL